MYFYSSPSVPWAVQFLALTKSCGKDLRTLTTHYVKNRLAFARKLPCVGLIKGIQRDHEKSVSVPLLCLSWFCKSLSSLRLLISFSGLKNPGTQFVPNFQLAETCEDVFTGLPNRDLVPAHHFNLNFETPLQPFPILPIWNKQHSLILRAAEFSMQRDANIL